MKADTIAAVFVIASACNIDVLVIDHVEKNPTEN